MIVEAQGGQPPPLGNESLAQIRPQPGADGRLKLPGVSTLVGLNGLHLDQAKENLFKAVSNPLWQIVRTEYIPQEQSNREVLNSLGNGYLGFRASLNKGSVHNPAAYVAGFFETPPSSPEEGITEPSVVTDLVRIPDFLIVDFHNGVDWFDIDSSKLLSFTSTLDMKQGVLGYEMRWEDSGGRVTNIKIEQFASQTRRHLTAMRYSIIPENYSDTITFRTGIDGRVDNKGQKYLSEKEKGGTRGSGIYYIAESKYQGQTVCLASNIDTFEGGIQLGVKPSVVTSQEQISQQVSIDARAGQTYCLDKSVAIFTSRDNDTNNPLQAARQAVLAVSLARNYDELLHEHTQSWQEKWQQADIEIEGDPEIQRAIRFNMFKLMQLANPDDETVSIAAKGLDNKAGEGYLGHVFWDTELFMLPFFYHNFPEAALAMLMFRYQTLPQAREKASWNGYKGAWYPWESAGGREATPRWIAGWNGELIPVYTGERECHISADIALAISEYYKMSGDEDFFMGPGAEILAETARFWASKAEYNVARELFEIKKVIGPDEYHEVGAEGTPGVDNNAYNNGMAKWNLEKALEVRQRYSLNSTVKESMGVTDEEAAQWRRIATWLYSPMDPESLLIEQFDGYHNLEDIDLSEYRGVTAMDVKLREIGKEPSRCKVTKQPDVMQLLINLRERNLRKWVVNHEYAAKNCCHGSSLSDAMHVISTLRAGLRDDAYKHLQTALFIDLNDKKGNNGVGIHAAALGGSWQAVVYGFGGVSPEDDKLYIDPSLPAEWQRLKFNIRYLGQKITVTETHDAIHLSLPSAGDATIPVEVRGATFYLRGGDEITIPLDLTDNQIEAISPLKSQVLVS